MTLRPMFQGISPQNMALHMVQYLHFRIQVNSHWTYGRLWWSNLIKAMELTSDAVHSRCQGLPHTNPTISGTAPRSKPSFHPVVSYLFFGFTMILQSKLYKNTQFFGAQKKTGAVDFCSPALAALPASGAEVGPSQSLSHFCLFHFMCFWFFLYLWVYWSMYLRIYLCIFVLWIYESMYLSIDLSIYVRRDGWMLACMYACMYVSV